jgi:hypothetical protein
MRRFGTVGKKQDQRGMTGDDSYGPVQPQHHTWMGRHKVWTTVLVLLVVAVACGAILCNIY